jgi:quinoprotein glucose dehydrogenase
MCNQYNHSNRKHLQVVPTRREVLIAGATLVAAPFLRGVTSIVQAAPAADTSVPVSHSEHAQARNVRGATTEWLSYGGDKASSKYSPLAQIGKDNFNRLKVAWTWRSADEEVAKANPHLKTWVWEATPLMVEGVLYVSTSMSQVAAIDAVTGKTLWVYDPETWKGGTPSNNGFVHRGVAYWADGNDRHILHGTGDGYLICLNAQTGKPISTFGQQGRVDLTKGLGRTVDRQLYGVSSPPIICRDVVVMGSKVHDFPRAKEMPPGHVRGFDVRTGKQLWIFHSVPSPREFGNETWDEGSWKTTGGANVWTLMSADDELGYVYLPFGTPSNDWYGGQRPGDGLFGESLVCLDARTGKRIWHFQLVHHGLWDYDLPAAPNLIDVRVNGRPVKAVAQVSKQGFVYVFDRVTGRPIWPIEERPVPQSTVPGEKSSRTQPFQTKPAPFDRQGVSENDVVDFTPELRREALAVLAKYNYGPLYTPPSIEKPTIQMPGWAGGASWAGAACDPETGMMYLPSITSPLSITMVRPPQSPAPYVGSPAPMETLQGLPLWKPPYGRITAIDLNTGDHRWMVPMGDLDHPRLKPLRLPPVGRPTRGHALLTKTLLIVGQEGSTQREQSAMREASADPGSVPVPNFEIHDPKLCAYDKATGKVIGEVPLPRNATAAPMTYMVNGRQYIVVATGGANLPAELIALLPSLTLS